MQIDQYLRRIDYAGPLEPTYSVLRELQKNHLLNIPFENLDIHTGRQIILDVEKIYEKVVVGGRGGFCYELNELFHELLVTLGFQARRISARVFNGQGDYTQEFDHMAVLVQIGDQQYLTDVGFGEFALEPLMLQEGVVQKDPRGEFIIDRYGREYWRVSKRGPEGNTPEYIFTDVPRQLAEYAGMCHYHQTSPDSHFTAKRLISRPTENGRITITGDQLKISEKDAVKEFTIKDESEFANLLWQYFKVKLMP